MSALIYHLHCYFVFWFSDWVRVLSSISEFREPLADIYHFDCMTYIMACVEAALYNSVYISFVCVFTAIILIQSDTSYCGIFIVLTTMASN